MPDTDNGPLAFTKAERLSMKLHPEMNEARVQKIIAQDPSLLGLGLLSLKDKERRQQGAGRLDLLFEHSESGKRYEVELQL